MKMAALCCLLVFLSQMNISLAQVEYHSLLGATPDANHPAPAETGMSPGQIDLKRSSEWRAWANRKASADIPGFFVDEAVEYGCRWYHANEASLKGIVIPLDIPANCEKAFRHQIKVTLHCGSGGGLSLSVPARGKRIYWSLMGVTGQVISNDTGAVQLNFISAEDFQIQSAIRLFSDAEMKKPLKVEKTTFLPDSSCGHS
jgi:hypothetical protein